MNETARREKAKTTAVWRSIFILCVCVCHIGLNLTNTVLRAGIVIFPHVAGYLVFFFFTNCECQAFHTALVLQI